MRARRPVLLPALVRAWRADDRLQLGVGRAEPVVLAGVDSGDARFLADLDGRRTRHQALQHAATLGIPVTRAERLLELLAAGDCLGDAAADATTWAALSEPDRGRLEPDVAAASLLAPAHGLGLDVLANRRRAHVEVRGAGRVGAAVVTLLAAAGVGSVTVVDDRAVRRRDVAPLGPLPDSVGSPRSDAAVHAARRTAPDLDRDCSDPPDLVVLTGSAVVDPGAADPLLSAATAHLPITVLETMASIGPLVVPGAGPCLRCVDLHRCDRDPEWPLVAAQVGPASGGDLLACDVVLATAAAALGTLLVLSWVGSGARTPDPGGPSPAIEVGTAYVLRLPDGRPRRRTYPPHPRCGCAWGATMQE